MPLTPEDVRNKRFTPVRFREGYDMGEVDDFLEEVEAELARLGADGQEPAKPAPSEGASSTAGAVTSEPSGPPAASAAADGTGSDIAEAAGAAARLLELATRNADQLVEEARTEAERVVAEARRNAEQLETTARSTVERSEAESRARSEKLDAEVSRRRKELLDELESQRDQVRAEVEDLRAFEREYRSRLKSYFEVQLQALEGSPESDLRAGGRSPAANGQPASGGSPERPANRLQALLGDEDADPAGGSPPLKPV
jgi:DivIVA domain-containing protein